jgi:hypothetical protein
LRGRGAERIERTMDARDFETAGLYDPSAPRAAERLELLQWLAARGVGLDQMVAADRASTLTVSRVTSHCVLSASRAREIATRYDLDLDYVMQLSLAVGLPPPRRIAQASRTRTRARSSPRKAGPRSSAKRPRCASRVSSARRWRGSPKRRAVALPGERRGSAQALRRTELNLAQQNVRGIESPAMVRMLMQTVFSAQMETAIRRFREARRARPPTPRPWRSASSIVGFTTFAHHVSTAELADVASRPRRRLTTSWRLATAGW